MSIVIPVYNDWIVLDQCLQSLASQANAPSFEVIIVDDGSVETTPEIIRRSKGSFPLTVIQQFHAGVSAARNRGIRGSRGAVLVFVDADCRLQPDCLAALSSMVTGSPGHECFQLRLVGNCSSLVGRAEALRLLSLQNYMLQPDGCIRYLNTAGFAIRRAGIDVETGLFDPVALRAEDTLLLANLIQRGKLPLFVSGAIVEHFTPLSLMGALRKDLRSVRLEAKAYEIIAAKGVRIRITHRKRVELLVSAWRKSGGRCFGRSAWFTLVVRQLLQRLVSFAYRFLRIKSAEHVSLRNSAKC